MNPDQREHTALKLAVITLLLLPQCEKTVAKAPQRKQPNHELHSTY